MSTTYDMKNRGSAAVHIPSASIASDTTTNGTGIDVSGAAAVMFVFASGAYTDGTYTPNVQESDDNSAWTDVSADRVIGAETAIGAANTAVSIGVHPTKKYVRLQIVSTSTTSGAFVGATVLSQTS